ncbi:uncharacterized protein PV09_00603 [Verruconis gallopava]|uniref:Uncharacterized protein n=1 Tax=Verruconis gallopava TaxID=253628 RepID=A0A0D2APM9_9PEZI|nr:uncharacterized protein PV09_00603 [Verruconis gallopava]KIW08648.1 hypothetical protein PV09_00603 [Verruconis gallopava]
MSRQNTVSKLRRPARCSTAGSLTLARTVWSNHAVYSTLEPSKMNDDEKSVGHDRHAMLDARCNRTSRGTTLMIGHGVDQPCEAEPHNSVFGMLLGSAVKSKWV